MSTASKKRAAHEIQRETAAAEPERVHLHMPVDIRSLSLVVLTVLVYSLFSGDVEGGNR